MTTPDATIIPQQSPVLTRARLVVDLLAASTAHGLPEPRYVTFHSDYRKVGVQLASPAAVEAWATWLAVDVTTSAADTEGGCIYRADGERGDVIVDAYHVEYSAPFETAEVA